MSVSRPYFCLTVLAIAALALVVNGTNATAQETRASKSAEARRSLLAVVPYSWKPQYDHDEEGKPVGFAIDVMNEIAKRAGLNVSYRAAENFYRAGKILDEGGADLIPNSRIRKSRLDRYAFSIPVETYFVSIFIRKVTGDISARADLDGRILGVVKNHVGVRFFRNDTNLKLEILPDIQTAVSQLISGKIDALVYSGPSLRNSARGLGVEDDIIAVGKPLRTIRRGIRVTKNNAHLLKRLNPAIKSFVGTPEYRRIYDKWFLAPKRFWTPTRSVWVMGGVLFMAVFAMAGWRYVSVVRLNRELRETIGDRESAERAAGEQAALFESAIANMGQGFNIYDADLRLVAYNEEYERILDFPPGFLHVGMSQDEVVRFRVERGDYGDGVTPEDLLETRHERIREEVERTTERTLPNGTTYLFHRKRLPDGGYVTTFTDVTATHDAERALHRSEELLRQAQKMEAVGQLTGGVAHDFNNLLMVIQGNAELLSLSLDGEFDNLMRPILRASKRGSELTQRLLAFSRRQTLQPRAIDLASLVAGMDGMLKRTLGETIKVETVVEPGLLPALADAGQVENALLNLAINARDAMRGGGRLTIECGNVQLDQAYVDGNPEVRAGAYVLLAVTDTGGGMPAEVLSHAFEPFFTTKEVGQGSGLGLSMIYGFAKQSGGHAAIFSEPGQGTTVRIYLPRADAAATEEDVWVSTEQPGGGEETILVIEDDDEVRALTVSILGGLGYRVLDVGDAAAAREILANGGSPDLILSDIVLPGGISGSEFAEEARAAYPGLKIVFMSGYSAQAAQPNDFPGSDDVLLKKPFQIGDLARIVRGALD